MKFEFLIRRNAAFFGKHNEEHCDTWFEFFANKQIANYRIEACKRENTNYKHLERMLKYEM